MMQSPHSHKKSLFINTTTPSPTYFYNDIGQPISDKNIRRSNSRDLFQYTSPKSGSFYSLSEPRKMYSSNFCIYSPDYLSTNESSPIQQETSQLIANSLITGLLDFFDDPNQTKHDNVSDSHENISSSFFNSTIFPIDKNKSNSGLLEMSPISENDLQLRCLERKTSESQSSTSLLQASSHPELKKASWIKKSPYQELSTRCSSIESFLTIQDAQKSAQLNDTISTSAYSQQSQKLYSNATELFDINTFKTLRCQNLMIPHDKQSCIFYHSNRDRRRPPNKYSAIPCPYYFDSKEPLCCPYGQNCRNCHSSQEFLYHPDIYLKRFCSSCGKSKCPRGVSCAFAHTREEARCQLYSLEDEKHPSIEFYMMRFKTIWCPYGTQHDWHTCLYAHTYQDFRRTPLLGYQSKPCQYWGKKNQATSSADSECPNGAQCMYSHGSKEQLYHPQYYKSMACADFRNKHSCPRGKVCAFYHYPEESRQPQTIIHSSLSNSRKIYDIIPLDLLKKLQPSYLDPPLFNLDLLSRFCGDHQTQSNSENYDCFTTDCARRTSSAFVQYRQKQKQSLIEHTYSVFRHPCPSFSTALF